MIQCEYKRINMVHLGKKFCRLSGILQDGMFGGKEIAVGIRSNSHYRISRLFGQGQVGMLTVPWQ